MNIIERVTNSKKFTEGEEFTSNDMMAHCRGCSKAAVRSVLASLVSQDKATQRCSYGPAGRINYYRKKNSNQEWLRRRWVSTPTPQDCRPKWEYHNK